MPDMATTFLETPLGWLRLAATPRGLCLVKFENRVRRVGTAHHEDRRVGTAHHSVLEQAVDELRAYFAGTLRKFTVPLHMQGTEFQVLVWRGLRRIPFGQTVSYGELAQRIGHPGAARAVGQANARNPIAIVVPCHRVIAASGRLHGFGGGLWRKRFLLDHERTAT